MVIAMDYKKKYKDALEKAKSMIDDLRKGEDILAVSNLESLFPELAESKDERIRKEILEFVTIVADSKSNKMEWIAWLEKQGKKSIDDLTQQEAMDIAVAKCFEQGEPKQEENDQKCAPFRIKKGEWYVCIHDFCNKGIKVGEIIQAEHDDTIRGIGFLYMENKYFRPAFENEKPQVDGFDAELNALPKKYEHLPKEALQEPLEFYFDVVRKDKSKWSEEDDYNVQCCIAKAEKDITNGYPGRNKELIEWLKSLKQRVGE